ncbi:unnamed protein product, partial [Vitis vinifera]|uniref:Uncharacterized protein n=1 Tax=Vitis vinifera TaxID=29760 RepID=D7T538_VITVI
MDPHQHQPIGQVDETSPSSSNTAATSCHYCSGPTTCPSPPAWSDISLPPHYRPIRAPTINLPPTTKFIELVNLSNPLPRNQNFPQNPKINH